MARLAIVGSRDFGDSGLVRRFVDRLRASTVVVSGGARGVDRVAVDAARLRDLGTEVFPADWDRFGRSAGIRRNADLVASVDGLVAFWDGSSPGTRDAIRRALDLGIWVRVYRVDGSFSSSL